MNKLYFGLLPSGTISDAFIIGVAGFDNTFVKPCIPELTSNGTLVYRSHEDYVIDFSYPFNPLMFRSIDWATKIDQLTTFLDNTNKNIWIGSTRPEQLDIIKSSLGERSVTVSINYDESLYQTVLKNYQSFITEQPMNLDTSLLPRSKSHKADYTLDLRDLYNQSKFINHLLNINININDEKMQYYNSWLTLQQNSI